MLAVRRGGEAERRRAPRGAELVDRRVGDRVDRDPQTGGRRLGLPRWRLGFLDSRGEIEQEHPQLDGGDAVDHRVVDLAGDRRAAPLELGHDEDLPERPAAIELLRQELVAQLAQLGIAHCPGNDSHVLSEIEVWVVRPCRLSKRHWPDHLAETRRQMQACRDPFPQELRVQGTRLLLETQTREPTHMHVGSGGLDAEKRGVERREPVHRRMFVRGAAPFHRPAVGIGTPGVYGWSRILF